MLVKGFACREREQTHSSFSPDELKRVMKKIKEDMNVVDKDVDERVRNQVIVSWFRAIKVISFFSQWGYNNT